MVDDKPQTAQQRFSGANVSGMEHAATDVGAFIKDRMHAYFELQSGLTREFPTISRKWFDRIQIESMIANDFAGKLKAAQSPTEATRLCQEWFAKRTEMAHQDATSLFVDTQKFIKMWEQFVSKDWFVSRS